MIYASSRNDSRELKRIYKKYSDLPNDMIRQIIEIKIHSRDHMTINEAISQIKSIRMEVAKISKALAEYKLSNRKNDALHFMTRNVFIEKEAGYCVAMDIDDALKRVKYLQSWNKEIMNAMRYQKSMKVIDLYKNSN